MKKKKLLIIFLPIIVIIALAIGAIVIYGPRYNVFLMPPSPEQYARQAAFYMERGIYADGEEWDKAKETLFEKAKLAKGYEDVYEAINEAAFVAGGKHSRLSEGTAAEIELKMPEVSFENGIMYIKLPAFGADAESAQKYIDTVTKEIAAHKDEINGVVIDLIDNTGGNMWPMIAAVSAFIPDGDILGFDENGFESKINLADGVLSSSGTSIELESTKITDVPVAILQNEWTASSGEATLLCFRGLSNVKTFGCPTAGYCSGNSTYFLYDGMTLLVTTSRDVARTGEVFCEDPIAPDVGTDSPLDDALLWINEY